MNISKNDKEIKWVEENIFYQPDVNELNFFSKNRVDKDLLYEGIFSTYPIETVRLHLMKRYMLDGDKVRIVDAENGTKNLMIIVPNTEANKKELDTALSRCGYYCSMSDVYPSGEKIALQYEKRIEDDANSLVEKKRFLYHLTPSACVPKIKEVGLCPRSQNKMFAYPSRIYLFLSIPQKSVSVTLASQLYRYIPKNEYAKKNGLYKTYSLLEIDTNKIPNIRENMVFYKDPNTPGGIFTMDNIPPDAISVKSSSINVQDVNF